jgi:hypothetical protein
MKILAAISLTILIDLAAVAAAAESRVSFAPGLSCDQFKARLAESIAKGGSKVIAPETSTNITEAQGSPQIRYEFHNIAGIEGGLTCEGADRFDNIDMSSKFDQQNAEGFKRFHRLHALAAAALCAEVNISQDECSDDISNLFSAARKEMLADDLRGRQEPIGDITKTYPSADSASPHVEIEVMFRRGEIWVGVSEAYD